MVAAKCLALRHSRGWWACGLAWPHTCKVKRQRIAHIINTDAHDSPMRQLAAIVGLMLLPAVARAQAPDVPTFADIPWGASAPEVVQAAATAGLRMVAKDTDGDYEFTGTLFDTPAVVFAFMSPSSGLVKIQVRLATPGDAARGKYVEVVDSLALQYGEAKGIELYKSPFQKGDGREAQAVRLGKGLLLASWGDDEQPGQAALVVRATGPVVGLDYESHDWTAELDRRKRKDLAL